MNQLPGNQHSEDRYHTRSIRPPLFNFQMAVTVIVTWLITMAIQWGLYSAKLDENARRIQTIEEQHFVPGSVAVTKDQFDEFRGDILGRLIRIEDKIDTQVREENKKQ